MAQRASSGGAEKGPQQRGTAALAWRSASRARAIPAIRVAPGPSVKTARHCASASSIHHHSLLVQTSCVRQYDMRVPTRDADGIEWVLRPIRTSSQHIRGLWKGRATFPEAI